MSKNAILIGNENYPNGIKKITSAQNDTSLMEYKLSILDFNIKKYLDLTKEDILYNVKKFIDNSACDSINIFYFSGHGYQLGGKNYIVPNDFDIKNPFTAGCSLDEIISLTKVKEANYIFIIDACRDNIDSSFKLNYAEMESTPNVFLAYATAFNHVASYHHNGLSFFTKVVCDYILTPNLSVQELFVHIRNDLYNSYGGQISNTVDSLIKPLVINKIIHTTEGDESIYNFVERFGEEYNIKFDYFTGEIELFIDASQIFNCGLLDVMYSYEKVSKKKYNMDHLDEASTKWISFKYLLKAGLKEENYSWNFRGRKIRLGELPPLPQGMKKPMPISGENIEVNLYLEYDKKGIVVKTNLPDGYVLNTTIDDFAYSQFSNVKNGECFFEFHQIPTTNDEYNVVITSPTVNVMSEIDKSKVGEKGRNLTGKFIKYDEVFGNMVTFSTIITF